MLLLLVQVVMMMVQLLLQLAVVLVVMMVLKRDRCSGRRVMELVGHHQRCPVSGRHDGRESS